MFEYFCLASKLRIENIEEKLDIILFDLPGLNIKRLIKTFEDLYTVFEQN